MRHDAEAAEPLHVLDDVARFPAERIRRRRHVDRDVVAAGRADLDAVQAQHAGSVRRRIGHARGVAVVGEDDELQARPRGGRGDLVGAAQAVRSVRVDVQDAGNRAVSLGAERQATGRGA